MRKISSATTIPTDFLGLSDGGAISGTSREIMVQSFIKTIETYRKLLGGALFEILQLMQGQSNNQDEEITTQFIWSDVITKSSKELIEELERARNTGLISQYTGIKLYLGLESEEEIKEEISKIQSNNIENETV